MTTAPEEHNGSLLIRSETDMKLKEHLALLRRYCALLIVATLLGGFAGAGVWLLMPTTYSARTELFVSVDTSGGAYELHIGSSFIRERIQTYVGMTNSAPVLQPVIDELDLHTTPDALATRVEAYTDPRTVLITVEATEDSPEAAQQLSAAVADSLVSVIGDIENPENEAANQIRLTVSNPAVAPQHADGPAGWLYVAAGLPVGFALGLGLALLRAALDNKLRSREDIERLNAGPVLGSIPQDTRAKSPLLVSQLRVDDAHAEAFRRLRTNLRFAQVDDPNPVVLVTSAQAKEGKSSTSINLAITAAQAGSRVALIDVDLRQPTVAARMGLENAAGLTTVLLGAADVSELLQPWGTDELYVLTAGEMPPNPVELLDSKAMSTLMTRLSAEFDLVILDSPPLLPVADSLVLTKYAGQVLLVAGVGEVRLNHLMEAVNSLSAFHIPTGVVLNKVPRSISDNYGYSARYPSRPASTSTSEAERSSDPLRNLGIGPTPPIWTAQYVHPAFPEDMSPGTSKLRSQS
ncbi:polysaccharide biosynthesis tyrosine autokinase [Nesterenkonia rhizosphaerae]